MRVHRRQRKHETASRPGESVVGAGAAPAPAPRCLSRALGTVSSSSRGPSGDHREILNPALTHQGSSMGKEGPAAGGAVSGERLGRLGGGGSASPASPPPSSPASPARERDMQSPTASLPRPTRRQPPSPHLPAEPWRPSALGGSLMALIRQNCPQRRAGRPTCQSLLPQLLPGRRRAPRRPKAGLSPRVVGGLARRQSAWHWGWGLLLTFT